MKSAKLSDLLRDRATIKGTIIVIGLFGGQQFSGIYAMVIIDKIVYKFIFEFFLNASSNIKLSFIYLIHNERSFVLN